MITKNVDTRDIIDDLITRDVISLTEKDKLNLEKVDRFQGAQTLLGILLRKRDEEIELFIESLKVNKYEHVAEFIESVT